MSVEKPYVPSSEEMKNVEENMTEKEKKMSEKRKEDYKKGRTQGFGHSFLEKKAKRGDAWAEIGMMMGDIGGNVARDKYERLKDVEGSDTFEAGFEKGTKEGIEAEKNDEKKIQAKVDEEMKKRFGGSGGKHGRER